MKWKSFVIFICLSDPFRAGLPVYTFTYRSKENPEIELKDDTIKVILNAAGDRTGLSQDMCAFFEYLQKKKATSKFTKLLDENVKKAINHKEWRVEYMTLEMIKQKEREKGREEERKNTEREKLRADKEKARADALEAKLKELETKI